jgi:hypothetical protein
MSSLPSHDNGLLSDRQENEAYCLRPIPASSTRSTSPTAAG